jgi:type II secretory pathway pseudopilin PulG
MVKLKKLLLMGNSLKNKKGFTIIELIFLIICLGILVSVIFPEFFSFFMFSDFKNTTNVFINFAFTAKNNKSFENDNDWNVILVNNSIRLIKDGTIFDKYNYSSNITIDAASDTNISFNPDGSTSKSTGYRVIFNFRNQQHIIEIDNVTGFVNIN